MECPNLDSRDPSDLTCRLRSGPYVPSEFQLVEVCTTDRHHRCPLYQEGVVTPRSLCRLEAERAVG